MMLVTAPARETIDTRLTRPGKSGVTRNIQVRTLPE